MGGIIDQLFQLLQQLILPDWSNLIALVPWVLIAIMIVFLVGLAMSWRRAGARTRSRVPRPLSGGSPPAGVHLPGPSRWPFVVPIGAALLLFAFALPERNADRPHDLALQCALPDRWPDRDLRRDRRLAARSDARMARNGDARIGR